MVTLIVYDFWLINKCIEKIGTNDLSKPREHTDKKKTLLLSVSKV